MTTARATAWVTVPLRRRVIELVGRCTSRCAARPVPCEVRLGDWSHRGGGFGELRREDHRRREEPEQAQYCHGQTRPGVVCCPAHYWPPCRAAFA